MNFSTFIFKKNGKKKLNLLPLLLMVVFMIIVYRGNLNGAFILENKEYREQELAVAKDDVRYFKEQLNNYKENTKEYKNTLYNIDVAQKNADLLEARWNAFQKKDWKAYYQSDNKLLDMSIAGIEANKERYGTDTIDVYKVDKKYAQYMYDHKLSFDNRFGPIQGVSFMAFVMNHYIPIILAILLIFVASNMYCSGFVDHLDIHQIIPISSLKKQGTKLVIGFSYGIIIFAFFAIFTLLCGSICRTVGSLQTPILTYTMEGINNYVPFSGMIVQFMLLLILAVLFIINFVSVIALITKRNLICFIISLAILLGLMWATTSIVPLAPILHMLPTTYLHSLKVISGELMYTIGNSNINFVYGIMVLTLSNLVLFFLNHGMSKFLHKGVRLHD